MTHTIFFSWQSDTGNGSDRRFIETCLNKALSKLHKEQKYKIDYRIDHATDKKQGSPDISDSIFKKINSATIFVADVTIINSTSRKIKKSPNPNVLVELGYAARVLGWENIICVLNTKYGKPESLPFDINGRRITCYHSEETKDKLIDSLFHAIKNTKNLSVPSCIVRDYYNAPLYTTLLQLIGDCGKFVLGYDNYVLSTKSINDILNLKRNSIVDYISNNYLLGFQLFKDYTQLTQKLVAQTEKILSLKQYDDSYYVPLINIIDILRKYDKEINRRGDLDKVEFHSKSINYNTIKSSDNAMPYRFVLLKKINKEPHGIVIDFGDFVRKDYQNALLNNYKLIPVSIRFYSGFYFELLSNINKWIDNNGGEFILDETILEIRH